MINNKNPIVIQSKNGLILYVVAYVHFYNGKKKADFEYNHSENSTHAKLQFHAANNRPGKVKIIDAAPVVGFYCDEHGENAHA